MLETISTTTSRRTFHRTLIQLFGGLMSAVIAAPAAAYLLLKPKSETGEDLVEIATLNDMPTGKPQEVVYYRTRVDGWKRSREKATAWVVKNSDQDAVAFHPSCTHLGCAYHWEQEKVDADGKISQAFVCPCHASSFGKTGEVLAGPAPRALDRYVSKIEGGKLLVSSEIQKAG